jgi:hypothetical protein
MNIIRDVSLNGNINTELFNMLKSIPENILYHNQHQLRHPLAIYNVSISRVHKAFEKLIHVYNNNQPFEEVSKEHLELLESLMSFIDDGYLIMKCFFPANLVQKKIVFAHEWLKKVDSDLIDEYQQLLHPYRDKLAKIVNRVKHEHGRYCSVEASTLYGKIKGYYIEGITKDEVIIPNIEIHPLFNDMYTAISFNKDIRRYLVHFYIISSQISKTIYKIMDKHYSIKVTPKKVEEKDEHKLIAIFESVSKLPELFFPDEYNNNLPQIIVKNEGSYVELRENSYKQYHRKLRKYTNCNFRTGFTGDGVTRSWALPYFITQKN